MIKHIEINKNSTCSLFQSEKGISEYFIVVRIKNANGFKETLNELHSNYNDTLEMLGILPESCVFTRFYLSDISNQAVILKESDIFKKLSTAARSIIEQTPIDDDIILFSHHLEFGKAVLLKEGDDSLNSESVILNLNNYRLFIRTNISDLTMENAYSQTSKIFEKYLLQLNINNMNLLQNAMRSWIYVRDIDNNYSGMVESRKKIFIDEGLNPHTRYLASTGIEARMENTTNLVSMDILAAAPLDENQIIRMEAPLNMGPTLDYGVTFERGTRILFGDRSHLYISGTASINISGDIMYLNDISKQTERALENVIALLQNQNASLNDMAYIIVYLRNSKESDKAKSVLYKNIPKNIPLVFVEGAVCRPGWLVEIEGLAIVDDESDFPPLN